MAKAAVVTALRRDRDLAENAVASSRLSGRRWLLDSNQFRVCANEQPRRLSRVTVQ